MSEPTRIKFFVAGIPKALSVGTTARAGGKTFQTRRGTPWATLVGYIGRQHMPPAPLTGPLAVTLHFYLPRPKSLPKRIAFPLKRPDLDNLFHKLLDAFSGVLWQDDSQVVDLTATKRFASRRPGLEVIVEPIEEEDAHGRIDN